MKRPDYRPYVPAPGESSAYGKTPRQHAKDVMQKERAQGLFATWAELYKQPFTGVTNDGNVVPGLFELKPEGAPTEAAVNATNALLAKLTPAQRDDMRFAVDAKEWWKWQNTEIWVEEYGLRLDEQSPEIRDAFLDVLKVSLSAEGYGRTVDTMRLNAFLGDLVGGPDVMNEWTYTFCVFGEPSTEQPWGWQLFGHHLVLNCMMIGGQMAVTPTFFGAEPCYADEGRFAGTSLFEDEERKGLALMQSLSPALQEKALIYEAMMGDDLPEGRWHFADHLHFGGAHRDNRVVPYEGALVTDFPAAQRTELMALVRQFVAPLPEGPLQARLAEIERHLGDTHFCWIGNREENRPFYYRIQSPVVMIEFDHHTGVFLTNEEPMTFHTHTIVRTPNGNDYGMDLLRLHYETAPHHNHDHGHAHGHDHGHKHAHGHKHDHDHD